MIESFKVHACPWIIFEHTRACGKKVQALCRGQLGVLVIPAVRLQSEHETPIRLIERY